MPRRALECQPRRRHLERLLAATLAVTLTGCTASPGPGARSADAASRRPSTALEIPLDPYLGQLRTVAVDVGGIELPFLFDTAGGVTLLTTETAADLGCEPFGRDVVFRHDGEMVLFQRCRGVDLRIGEHALLDREVVVWDLMALLAGAPELGGLVSLETFQGELLSIDLPGSRLWLETPASLEARIRDSRPLEVRASLQGGGSALDLFVAVDSTPGPLWFELDSGALTPILLAPHAAELLGLELTTEPQAVSLPISGLGPIEVSARLQEDLIYDGLLSAAFFEKVVLSLDLEKIQGWALIAAPGDGPAS